MKSIKERARELWGNLPVIQEDYIADIEEALERQRAIDIDKAYEWLCEHIDDYVIISEDGAWVEHSVVKDFKKAMEEHK